MEMFKDFRPGHLTREKPAASAITRTASPAGVCPDCWGIYGRSIPKKETCPLCAERPTKGASK